MKTTQLVAIITAFAAVCAFAGIIEANGAPEPMERRDAPTPHAVFVAAPIAEAPADPARARLAAYTLGVMRDWAPALIPSAPYEDVANDIAAAVLDKPSATPGSDAVLLAALAYWEGARFANYVDQGWCNDPGWRKDGVEEGTLHRGHQHGLRFDTSIWTSEELMHVGGDCDGGRAHGLWQIWYAYDSAAPIYPFCSKKALIDRRSAARCALEIARSDASLCGYAGERWALGCPKAELRRKFALDALAKHPFSP